MNGESDKSIYYNNLNVAERVGVFNPASRNPNEDGPISLNSHKTSDLALTDSFFGFRPFAPIF